MSKFFKIIFIAIFVGLISGSLSTLFLYGLTAVTQVRESSYLWIWGLPLFGLFLGLIIKRIPPHINQGVPYILKSLDSEDTHVSPWMTPLVFLGALGTHLFGGSAGREGVGVIMGASISQLLPQVRNCLRGFKTYLIYSGIAAGFASIFGTPLAAIVFAFELHGFCNIKDWKLVVCIIASAYIAFIVLTFIGPEHTHYAVDFSYDSTLVYYFLIASVTSAFGGQLFYWGVRGYSLMMSKLVSRVEFRLLLGGLIVSLLVFLTDSYSYIGIGTDVIARSFNEQMHMSDFFFKCLLTVMTISVGFKGGEVTPLFFMGATLSNSTASFLGLKNFSLSSALGMVSLFGAATGTPLASAIMGWELFGWEVGALSLVTCYIARLLMVGRSIYRD